MVQIPKNPCPAATDATVRFFCAAGSYVKWGVVTVATSETTKKTIACVSACLGRTYQTIRHSACMERCIKRLSREDSSVKSVTVVDHTGTAQTFPVAEQPPADDGAKKDA